MPHVRTDLSAVKRLAADLRAAEPVAANALPRLPQKGASENADRKSARNKNKTVTGPPVGSYTIPGGVGFVMVNAYPLYPAPEGTESGPCGFCGKTHPNTLWGRIVAFFHMIFAFFRDLFKA